MEKKPTSHVQKALIVSLIMMVLSIVFYFVGFKTSGWTQYLVYLVMIVGVVMACISYSKDLNGNITFGGVFGHGFKMSAAIACIMIVFAVLFIYLFPEMKEKGFEEARIEMEKNPGMTEEQIDMAMEFTKKYFMVFVIGGGLVGYIIIGVIGSLIGAGVAKKNPQPTPFQ